MKGITRVKGGYLARHYWGKSEPIYEYFYDREYGTQEGAQQAAARWLKRISAEYPAPPKPKRQPGISYTHDVNHSGMNVPCVEVFWTSYPDGKKHTQKFRYHNDLEKAEAERKAKNFLEARQKEIAAADDK